MSQRDRVRKVLLARGFLYRTDFLLPNVIDGGKPILNLGERISDLRKKEGLNIETERLPNNTALYTLVGQQPAPEPIAPIVVADVEPVSLFDDAIGHAPPRSPYDAIEEAA